MTAFQYVLVAGLLAFEAALVFVLFRARRPEILPRSRTRRIAAFAAAQAVLLFALRAGGHVEYRLGLYAQLRSTLRDLMLGGALSPPEEFAASGIRRSWRGCAGSDRVSPDPTSTAGNRSDAGRGLFGASCC